MKVSIILPVYNAEATLPKCLESIHEQTYRNIQLVAVDDCSTDVTLTLLKHFKEESGIDTTIVHHEKNRGVAIARNTGLDIATGDYICWIDADDWLEPDAISKMMYAIGKSDILGFDWILEQYGSRYMRQADWSTPLEAMKAMMKGIMRWNLWMFMAKRSLFEENNIRFKCGQDMGEDMLVTFKLMMAAKDGVQLHKALYHYMAPGDTSVSHSMGEKQRNEVTKNLEALTSKIDESRYRNELLPLINNLKLFIKRPLLVTGQKADLCTWSEWMPEANREAICSSELPFHTKWLQRMAALNIWFGVKLYYIIVYRILKK